jgi:hypothetical protein
MLVEEVAERTVAGIVKECGNSQQRFEKWQGKVVRKRGMEVPGETSGHMHGSQGLGEPGMFCRGKDEAGALKLIDRTKALNPGIVDQIPFAGPGTCFGVVYEREISVDRI